MGVVSERIVEPTGGREGQSKGSFNFSPYTSIVQMMRWVVNGVERHLEGLIP